MSKNLLYIEDDEIDVLALKRIISSFDNVVLKTCSTVAQLADLNLSEFDYIISDCHLPDGDYSILSKLLPKENTTFISGDEIDIPNSLVKPISKEDLEEILNSNQITNLNYIRDLADGDVAFEKEMIETAISVLPDRLQELKNANDRSEVKKAAHKARSSFRVCGIDSSILVKLESISEEDASSKIVAGLIGQVEAQIKQSLRELRELL